MNIREMVISYLKIGNYDGLAGCDCGCGLPDIMPCECTDMDTCVAGHRRECVDCEDRATCDMVQEDCGGHCYKPGRRSE